MTATSGPGMSLKTEMLGLASIAELPLVVVNVQRGGPSTGMPTKSEQADLFQAVFSAHGDVAPAGAGADRRGRHLRRHRARLQHRRALPDAGGHALRPGDRAAQGVARSDRHDAASPSSSGGRRPRPSCSDYRRFRFTDDGVSPISHPGMPGGNYQGAGIEHNEAGAPTASGAMHARMNEKRFRKLDALRARRRSVPHRGRSRRRAGADQLGQQRRRLPRGAAAGAGRGPARQAAGALSALPGDRGDLPRLLRRRARRPGGRAVVPGAAVPHPAHVRRPARRRCDSLARSGANPFQPGRDRRAPARAGAAPAATGTPTRCKPPE